MAGEGGDKPGDLPAGRKLRVWAYVTGAFGVLVLVGLLGFQILSP